MWFWFGWLCEPVRKERPGMQWMDGENECVPRVLTLFHD